MKRQSDDKAVMITSIIQRGIKTDEERELLGNSLFYLCSGIDPSPVLAFEADYPLYIYADINLEYEKELPGFYMQIQERGNSLESSESLLDKEGKVFVSRWLTADNKPFCVVYYLSDAVSVFSKIYSDYDAGDRPNFILPKCVCNYRYEFLDEESDFSYAFCKRITYKTEYIYGECLNDKYSLVGTYEGKNLYHRKFWYVF